MLLPNKLCWGCLDSLNLALFKSCFTNSCVQVPAMEAIDRVSAHLIAPYPPGVDVVAPREVLTDQIVNGLAVAKEAGVRITYAGDSTLETYRVIE